MSSRNRPRGAVAKEDVTDEQNLWNSILEKVRKVQALNERYEDISSKLAASDQTVSGDDPATAITILENLSNLHREGLKQVDEEVRILDEEPDDLIKNVDILISVRSAMEAESPISRDRVSSVAPQATKPAIGRNAKRKLDALATESAEPATPTSQPESTVSVNIPFKPTTPTAPASKKGSRAGSVNAGKADSLSETDSVKNVASPAGPTFSIGQEVLFKHNKNKSAAAAEIDGEGITCKIREIMEPTMPGKSWRYKVQDAEPEEGENPPIFQTLPNALHAIPISSAGLPTLPRGKQVLAKYPNTSTFYHAEMVATTRKDTCKLKFEDEDQPGTEREVERRYVLDVVDR